MAKALTIATIHTSVVTGNVSQHNDQIKQIGKMQETKGILDRIKQHNQLANNDSRLS